MQTHSYENNWGYKVIFNELTKMSDDDADFFINWLEDNVGRLGISWGFEFKNDSNTFVYYFNNIDDFTFFKLTWISFDKF